ncbi:GNAT family N-acetyltransferase [Roseomonas sp. 18066]|uniref:GNAT family N-acetyltransferase n=1 Tax=Roseomonas sp. 18066 TaxID=2681412 RepID=UPI00135A6B32|nr:GNAT family N-acetyltransferase [Roseomonas sp. 18066]
MGLILRAATGADRDALVEQFQGLNVHEDGITGDRRRDRDAAIASLEAADAKVARSQGHALVAEQDGAVIGHCYLTFERHPPYVTERDYAYVAELYVRPEARSQGLGRALLAEAERLARARGMKRMLIGVVIGNDRAQAAYQRFGFSPYTTELIKPLD